MDELKNLGLIEVHMDAIRLTPFWYFVDAAVQMDIEEYNLYKKPDSLIADMMEHAACRKTPGVDGFDIGGKNACPGRMDLKLIFGIRDGGGQYMSAGGMCRPLPSWIDAGRNNWHGHFCCQGV